MAAFVRRREVVADVPELAQVLEQARGLAIGQFVPAFDVKPVHRFRHAEKLLLAVSISCGANSKL